MLLLMRMVMKSSICWQSNSFWHLQESDEKKGGNQTKRQLFCWRFEDTLNSFEPVINVYINDI